MLAIDAGKFRHWVHQQEERHGGACWVQHHPLADGLLALAGVREQPGQGTGSQGGGHEEPDQEHGGPPQASARVLEVWWLGSSLRRSQTTTS